MSGIYRTLMFLVLVLFCASMVNANEVPNVATTATTSPMTAIDVFAFIREFGFQTFITLYLLLRFEKRIDRITQVMEGLNTVVVLMQKTVDALPPGNRRA